MAIYIYARTLDEAKQKLDYINFRDTGHPEYAIISSGKLSRKGSMDNSYSFLQNKDRPRKKPFFDDKQYAFCKMNPWNKKCKEFYTGRK